MWNDWKDYVRSLDLTGVELPGLRQRAKTSGELYYNPAYREIERQRRSAKQQYGWGKREVEPEYQRYVAEQRAGLAGQRAATGLAREQVEQDYDISGRSLSDQYADTRRRLEQDMARRGLWQSGLLSRSNLGLGQKYLTGASDLERQRTGRLDELTSAGRAAEERALFNLSDAQRARLDQMKKLYEAYTGTTGELNLKRQQLSEEQGTRASSEYGNLMDQYRNFALQARQQGLNEQKFHHDAYWAAQDDQFKRQQYADQLARYSSGGGGGGYRRYGGGGYRRYGGGTGASPEGYDLTPDEQAQYRAEMNEVFKRMIAAARNTRGPGNPVGKSSFR